MNQSHRPIFEDLEAILRRFFKTLKANRAEVS
jgi:hypothetical protein